MRQSFISIPIEFWGEGSLLSCRPGHMYTIHITGALREELYFLMKQNIFVKIFKVLRMAVKQSTQNKGNVYHNTVSNNHPYIEVHVAARAKLNCILLLLIIDYVVQWYPWNHKWFLHVVLSNSFVLYENKCMWVLHPCIIKMGRIFFLHHPKGNKAIFLLCTDYFVTECHNWLYKMYYQKIYKSKNNVWIGTTTTEYQYVPWHSWECNGYDCRNNNYTLC